MIMTYLGVHDSNCSVLKIARKSRFNMGNFLTNITDGKCGVVKKFSFHDEGRCISYVNITQTYYNVKRLFRMKFGLRRPTITYLQTEQHVPILHR
jgi:hypothetical protein